MNVEEALAEALEFPPLPETAAGLVKVAGGENRDLALLVAGLPADTSKLPSNTGPGSARRVYDNTMRSIQRYRKKGGGETRGQVKPEQLTRWQQAVRPAASDAFIKAIRRRGCRCRVIGVKFVISADEEEVDSMPVAGRPGAFLPKSGCQAFTTAYRNNDMAEAAALWSEVFLASYSFEALEYFDDVEQIKLWLDSEPEP